MAGESINKHSSSNTWFTRELHTCLCWGEISSVCTSHMSLVLWYGSSSLGTFPPICYLGHADLSTYWRLQVHWNMIHNRWMQITEMPRIHHSSRNSSIIISGWHLCRYDSCCYRVLCKCSWNIPGILWTNICALHARAILHDRDGAQILQSNTSSQTCVFLINRCCFETYLYGCCYG